MSARSNGRADHRWATASLLLAMALLLATPLAATALARPGQGGLSPRLAELAKPAVRSASRPAQARALGVARHGPGSLIREGGRVLASVRFEADAEAAPPLLREAGAEVVHVDIPLQRVTIAAPPAAMPAIAALPLVASVSEVLAPLTWASCQGAVVSEGDVQLGAASARSSFGLDGGGVRVGILSDSFDRNASAPTRAADDVASGDLPGPGGPCGSTPVDIFSDVSAGADEGRAMAQIVHDLAPDAALDFATAFSGEGTFADNIRALAARGAQVIVDDVAYFEEPFFQDGPVAVAVDQVASAGVSYFAAAGNSNVRVGGSDTGSWEAPAFRDASEATPPAGCPVGVPVYAVRCMDFDPEAGQTDPGFSISVASGATLRLALQWAQPWYGVGTDLDAYLMQGSTLVAASEADNVGATQRPAEVLQWTNATGSAATVQLSISRCGSVCNPLADDRSPRLKFILFGAGATPLEYLESAAGDTVGPTVFGHAAADGAIAAAAVRYDTTSAPEPFSSRGPAKRYFGPVLSTTPAAPISEQVLAKPDLAATDGGANTFFGQPVGGVWRFFGTSAAAPHAAAVAALVRQRNPSASAAQVRAALAATTRPVGAFGPDAVGAGLLDALGAVEAIGATSPLPPVVVPPAASTPSPLEPAPAAEPNLSSAAPRTFFRRRPPKLVRTRRARARVVFRFGSDQAGATFLCRVDRSRFRRCRPRFVRRLRAGRHVVRVKARGAGGRVDRTPAVYRFRVKRIR